ALFGARRQASSNLRDGQGGALRQRSPQTRILSKSLLLSPLKRRRLNDLQDLRGLHRVLRLACENNLIGNQEQANLGVREGLVEFVFQGLVNTLKAFLVLRIRQNVDLVADDGLLGQVFPVAKPEVQHRHAAAPAEQGQLARRLADDGVGQQRLIADLD